MTYMTFWAFTILSASLLGYPILFSCVVHSDYYSRAFTNLSLVRAWSCRFFALKDSIFLGESPWIRNVARRSLDKVLYCTVSHLVLIIWAVYLRPGSLWPYAADTKRSAYNSMAVAIQRLRSTLPHLKRSISHTAARNRLIDKKPDDVVITFAMRTPLGRANKGQLKVTMVDELLRVLFKVNRLKQIEMVSYILLHRRPLTKQS